MIRDDKPRFYTSILATILVLSLSCSILIYNAAAAEHDSSQAFSKVTAKFTIKPGISPIMIDDILYAAEDLPVSFEWIAGSGHTIKIPETEVFDENGVKYVFNGWNDLNKYASRGITVVKDFSYIAYFVKEDSQPQSVGKEWSVTVSSLPRQSPLIIDGIIYLPSELPVTFNWIARSEHNIGVPEEVFPAGEQTRYVFSGWNDLNKEMKRKVGVSGDASFIALFDTQYLLKIDSPFGAPKGQGWYDSYDIASISIDPAVQIIPGKERAIFAGWSEGDNHESIQNIVTMNEAKTIEALWKTQYYVSVTSNLAGPNVKGTGWYDEEAQVLISADAEYQQAENNHKFTFAQWRNVGENKNMVEDAKAASTSLKVTDSVSLEASWDEYWYLKINSPYGAPFGEGYYRADEVAKAAVISPFNVMPEESRLVFTGWSGDSNSEGVQAEVVMNEYKELTGNWKEQYYLKIISKYPDVEGSGWYDKGSITNFEAHDPQNGGLGRQILFQQWSGDFQHSSEQGIILMDRPHTVIANYYEDVAFLYYVIGAIAGIVVVPIAFVMLRPHIRERLEARIHEFSKKSNTNDRRKRRLRVIVSEPSQSDLTHSSDDYVYAKERYVLDKATTIQIEQYRTWSYLDFKEIDHAYFKNIIYSLKKQGKIETVTRSRPTFYRVKGIDLPGRHSVTTRMGVTTVLKDRSALYS